MAEPNKFSEETAPAVPSKPDVEQTLEYAGATPDENRHPSDKSISQLSTAAEAAAFRRSLPGFEEIVEIARGGMGVVYKARDVQLKRLVAIKMILAGAHAGETELRRFRNEAQALARLQHPNIVQIHDIAELDGLPYLVLEYCGGQSLAQRLFPGGLPIAESLTLMIAVTSGVQAAHERNIIHRDLKPANILFTIDGNPKLSDFGLAKFADSEQNRTASGAIVGTPSYMSPEQASGKLKLVGPASDVYGLGAIFYALLTGRPPFQGESHMDTILKVIHQEPIPVRELRPDCSPELEAICRKCLAKRPEDRYSNVGQLLEDLRKASVGEAVQVTLPPSRPFSTEHLPNTTSLVDGRGTPLEVDVTAGQTHDSQRLEPVLIKVRVRQKRGRPRSRPKRLAGDKGYSSDRIRQFLKERGIEAIIPHKDNEKARHDPDVTFDQDAYRRRSIVEQSIGWLKECRRIGTRFEKLAINFLAMVKLAMIKRTLRMVFSNRD